MIIYKTENSIYEVDPDKMTYIRMPYTLEQDVLSHRLTYGEEHKLQSLPELVEQNGYQVLHIMREDSVLGIYTSPIISSEIV